MPAIVLVGAQWGDEGKGKATDLLGSLGRLRREVQRRQQRRPHGRHRRREVRPPPAAAAASSPPASCPVIGNGVVVDLGGAVQRDRRARGPRHRHVAPGRQRQRAPDRAATTSTLDKVTERFLGSAPDRHDRPRHRPDVRRQDVAGRRPRAGPVRREDPAPEGRGRARAEEPPARQGLQPARDRRSTRSSRSCSATPTGCARWSPTPRCCSAEALDAGRDRAARGRPGDAARRRPRHLSVRHVVQPDRRRRVHRARASRRPASTG